MRYMKEVLRNNKKWVIVYLLIGLFNAFMSNYKADYFQKVVDGLTDRTMTVYEILFYGVILFINYGTNYIDEYPSAKLGNGIYLDFKLLALRKIGRMDYCIFGNESAAERIVSDKGKDTDQRGRIKPFSCAWFYGNADFPYETSISK